MILVLPKVSTPITPTSHNVNPNWMNIYTMQLLLYIKHTHCILSDSEGSLLTFSQSCNGDKKENPHSHHLQLHHHCVCTSVLPVWKLSWKHFVWYYLVCHNARHILYLHPKHLVIGCARHVFSIAFESSSPLNDESSKN